MNILACIVKRCPVASGLVLQSRLDANISTGVVTIRGLGVAPLAVASVSLYSKLGRNFREQQKKKKR